MIAKHQGPRTVEAFAETTDEAQTYLELKSKEEKTTADRVELLEIEIGMGKLDLDEAESRREELASELTPEQAEAIDAALVDLRVMDMVEEAQPRAKSARADLGGRFHEMYQEGARPDGARAFQTFYILMLDYAEREGDAGLFEELLGRLRDRFGDQPGAERFFKQQEKRLEALR